MKRLIHLTLVFISLVYLSACSDDSSDSTTVGLIAPNFDSPYTWAVTKQYTDLGTAANDCSGDNCICVYINEEIAGVSYTGFAVRSNNNDFNIKIYSSDSGSTYTVVLKDGTTNASCSNVPAATIFSSLPSVDSNNFASATFTNNIICSSAYTYGGSNIVAPGY